MKGLILSFMLVLVPTGVCAATNDQIAEYLETPAELMSMADLKDLVGPIALYPDDLVALTLPASIYPLQVVQAARFLRGEERSVPKDEWDDAVIALLNYPEVVTLLNADLDWLASLGNVFLSQPGDVFAAIQAFRYDALAAGNLVSDDKQVVQLEDSVITISSRFRDQVHVPYYEPKKVVTYQPRPSYHYHDRVYPTYYYPYSAGSAYSYSHFYGLPSFYAIGWGGSHLYAYYPEHHRHPYYRSRLSAHYGYGNYFRYRPRHSHTQTLSSPLPHSPREPQHEHDRHTSDRDGAVWQAARRPGSHVRGSGINIDQASMQARMRAAKAEHASRAVAPAAPSTPVPDMSRAEREQRGVAVRTTRSRIVSAGQRRSGSQRASRDAESVPPTVVARTMRRSSSRVTPGARPAVNAAQRSAVNTAQRSAVNTAQRSAVNTAQRSALNAAHQQAAARVEQQTLTRAQASTVMGSGLLPRQQAERNPTPQPRQPAVARDNGGFNRAALSKDFGNTARGARTTHR
ncbi:MAG: DUF3300 domain-containing protein [Proteobacteria bacterium]|nr:DUF3300 domain-containing protein [Pseudomonadota bacterium]